MIDQVIANAPAPLRASLEGLLQRPSAPRETLLADLDAYTQRIDDAVRRRPDLDVNLAEAIMQACRTLLGDDWAGWSNDQRRLIQLVCEYYVDSDDEDGDLESVFGFDDDAEVLNLALDSLQRSELKVRV